MRSRFSYNTVEKINKSRANEGKSMVFYFTATGNSLYVVKRIDEYPVSIPQVIKNLSNYSDNQIGIVCPVYCGEIPNTVKEFLKKLKFDTKYMYLILTYGNSASDCPEFTYNEFKALGINFDYIDTVHCVDNYLPVFDMAVEKKIDKDTDIQIAHIIKNIRLMKKGVSTATDADRKLHKQVATLNKIIPSFNNGKMIKITDKCIGCKVCEKVCPTGNIIVLTDYAQRRSKKCEYCLASVHACPQKAVIIKHEKNKNERYRNENVSLDEIIKSNFQDRRKSYE